MERNELGHFAKGNRIGTAGLTPKEKRASQRLRQRLSALVDDAALVLEQVVAGEEIDKARVDAAKYIVDRCLGKPGSSQVVSGSVQHEHSVADRYVGALKELAIAARAERTALLDNNSRTLGEMKKEQVIDVESADVGADARKVRYGEKMRAEEAADG